MGGTPISTVDLLQFATQSASDLTTLVDLLRLLVTPPTAPERPADPFVHPADAARQTFQGTFWAVKDLGIPQSLAYLVAALAAAIVVVGGVLGEVFFWLIKNVGATLTIDMLELVDDVRKDLNPTMVGISTAVLNELLGTDYRVDPGSAPGSGENPILNAEQVGGLLHDRLLQEFQSEGDVTPESGRTAARRMSGFLINFGVATAFVSILGETLSFGKFEQLRELGVEVARNLGLGRLNRQAMKPLVDVMIAQPYKWWFNTQFHPTQFKIGEVINPFTATLMPVEDVFAAADLEGYSHDKVEKLIKLHQKRLSIPDVELLTRWKLWQPDQAHSYTTAVGYPEELADTVLSLEQLHRLDARLNKLIDALEAAVVDGHITVDEFKAVLATMPLSEEEQTLILTTVGYKTKSPHKALTFAELQNAFDQGLIDDTDLRDRLSREGYAEDDVKVLEILTLLKLAKLEDAQKAKAERAAKKPKGPKGGTGGSPPIPGA